MTSERDFDRLARAWLELGPDEAPDRVVAAVLQAAETTPQVRRPIRWPTWRSFHMNRMSLAAGAVAILVVVMGGGILLNQRNQAVTGGPSPTPGVTSSQPAVVAPSATPGVSASPRLSVVQPRAPSWTITGGMGTPRSGHTATLLPDGKVLVAGGYVGDVPAQPSAELYDPASGSWTATGNMVTPRIGHSATLLPDGKVLVAGGLGKATQNTDGRISDALSSAELYDPTTGFWTATGSMATTRQWFTATLLPDGKVLVAGGGNRNKVILASAELYDPGAGTWTATGSMGTQRYEYASTLLPDGKVLVAGGFDSPDPMSGGLDSAELYDPGSGTWIATGTMTSIYSGGTLTLLPDGRVLAGGVPELYDPGAGTWTAGNPGTGGTGGRVILLPDGRVLAVVPIMVGDAAVGTSVDVYDPGAGSWTAAGKGNMGTPRYTNYTTTLLPDGEVLVAGGLRTPNGGSELASADLYDPGTGTR